MSHTLLKNHRPEIGPQNRFSMINIGAKRITHRIAVASGRIEVGKRAFNEIIKGHLPKGDVLTLAEIAGITGAKKTADIIPLCHPLALDQVITYVEPDSSKNAFTVYCKVSTHAKTGVEMEALMGVSSALLTIYDLTKGIEPHLKITDVRLLVKLGGKSGTWISSDGIPAWLKAELPQSETLAGRRAAILVMSDRAAKGIYEDKSGALMIAFLEKAGAEVIKLKVIPDDKEVIKTIILELCREQSPDLILTTGGVGLSTQDLTPEALQEVCDRIIPGISELLRGDGANFTKYSWLARSLTGMIGHTLIVSLPGNPNAVEQGLEVLLPLLPHALATIKGGDHND